MDRLSAPEQNRLLAGLSNLLRRVEQDSGPEFLPRGLDVMGLVRQLALPSAETVEKLSYGDPLFRMPTQSNIPITTDRGYVAEVLGMAPAVPAASRATTRISNEMADQLVRAITGNPQATAPAALEAAGQMAPLARVMSGASRDTIRSSADELADQLKSLGFQADVTHSGSAAGPSSYVRIYDPETGRFFVNPVRFSGHSKGSFNAGEVIDVQDPSVDIPNIVQEALALRGQGPSDVFKKQQLVDDLIQQGVSPKQAYKQADEMIAKGLLEPEAGVKDQNKQFFEMAEKGQLRLAKDRSKELKDLQEGKSKFAELYLNWDDPETYDLVDNYAEKGFKTKVVNQGGRNVTYMFKDEKDIEGILKATTPADYGRAYGYSDEDIARFYLERGLGPTDFFEDMSK